MAREGKEWAAVQAFRKSCRMAVSSTVCDAHLVELGVPLRRSDVAAAPAPRATADGLGHAIGMAEGLDHKVRRNLLDPLVVDAVDAHAPLPGYNCARRVPGTMSISWKCWS